MPPGSRKRSLDFLDEFGEKRPRRGRPPRRNREIEQPETVFTSENGDEAIDRGECLGLVSQFINKISFNAIISEFHFAFYGYHVLFL